MNPNKSLVITMGCDSARALIRTLAEEGPWFSAIKIVRIHGPSSGDRESESESTQLRVGWQKARNLEESA